MGAPADTAMEDPFLRFPPFPTAPPGVVVIPFKEFQEHGIQISSDSAQAEVCGLGIPTVELSVNHGTDKCKTGSKKRKKKTPGNEGGESKRREWWETWADGDNSKGPFNYDAQVFSSFHQVHCDQPCPNRYESDVARIHQATLDFKKSRVWPPQGANLSNLWDQVNFIAQPYSPGN